MNTSLLDMVARIIQSKVSFFERQEIITAFQLMLKQQQILLDKDIIEETKNRN